MACNCKRLMNKAEREGKIGVKKMKVMSKIITFPIVLLFAIVGLPILMVYIIYIVMFKDSKIIVPKKFLKYFRDE